MKKKFQKISKIVFIVGVVAIIALVIILANAVETTDGVLGAELGYMAMVCVGAAFLSIIFAVINFIVAFIDGMKRNSKDFLKRFIVQFVVMVLIYVFLNFTDAEKELDMIEIMMSSLAMSLGIIGGEYMISPPKEEEEELHF